MILGWLLALSCVTHEKVLQSKEFTVEKVQLKVNEGIGAVPFHRVAAELSPGDSAWLSRLQ